LSQVLSRERCIERADSYHRILRIAGATIVFDLVRHGNDDTSALTGSAQPFEHRLTSARERPARQQPFQAVARGKASMDAHTDGSTASASFVDQPKRLGRASPVRPSDDLMMRHLSGQSCFFADADALPYAVHHAGALVP